jgi:N-methylhydantoinase B
VAAGAVSAEAAREIYGVIFQDGEPDVTASHAEQAAVRARRVGAFDTDPARRVNDAPLGALGEGLRVVRNARGMHVTSTAGYILATGSTRWRQGAKAVTVDQLPEAYRIALHRDLACTAYYCPASGALLAVDFHRRDEAPADDLDLDMGSLESLNSNEMTGAKRR